MHGLFYLKELFESSAKENKMLPKTKVGGRLLIRALTDPPSKVYG